MPADRRRPLRYGVTLTRPFAALRATLSRKRERGNVGRWPFSRLREKVPEGRMRASGYGVTFVPGPIAF